MPSFTSPPAPPSSPTFDMRVWFLNYCDKLMTHNANAALLQDVNGWFLGLEEMTGKLCPLLGDTISNQLQVGIDALYSRIYNPHFVNKPNSNSSRDEQEAWIREYTSILRDLRAYDNKLVFHLHKIGLFLPKKPDLKRILVGDKR